MVFRSIHGKYAYTTILALCLSQYPRGVEFTFEDKEISFSSYGQKIEMEMFLICNINKNLLSCDEYYIFIVLSHSIRLKRCET